jgi:hypothetical protein
MVLICFTGCEIVYTPPGGETVTDETILETDTSFIGGDFDVVGGDSPLDIVSDNLVEEIMALGFTREEATTYREVFLMCGINNIEGAAPTNATATIDDLVAYRIVMDDDRTMWFTIEKRELFYIALNGVDVYDTSQGGFLININDVHIPENDISRSTAETLRDLTISTVEPYFVNALYYDGFRYGRSDDAYMVQCEVYAQNKLGVKDWIFAKVWYEFDGTEFVVTAVVVDGNRYK